VIGVGYLSPNGGKISEVYLKSTIGQTAEKRVIYSVSLSFSIRYSSIIEDSTGNYGSQDPSATSYLATTSTSLKLNPQFSQQHKPLRSNSQNRVLSPTFSQNYDKNSYASLGRKPERLYRHSSLGHENPNLPNSGSASSLRLDNYVTLHRRRSNFSPTMGVSSNFVHSPSPSPMVLSPSNTRQFFINTSNGQNYPTSSSREGSVTPRYVHSCSNTSLVANNDTVPTNLPADG